MILPVFVLGVTPKYPTIHFAREDGNLNTYPLSRTYTVNIEYTNITIHPPSYTHTFICFFIQGRPVFSGSLPFNGGQVSIQKGLSPAQAAIRRDRHTASQCIGSGILQLRF